MDKKVNDFHNQIPHDDPNDNDEAFLHILREDRSPAGLKQTMKADLRNRFDAERTTQTRRPFFRPPPRTFYTAAGAFALVAIVCVTYLLVLNPPKVDREIAIRPTATPTLSPQQLEELAEELFTAIVEQDSGQVEALIEMGVDVNQRNSHGIPPLQASIILNNPKEIGFLLIDAGAAVDEKIFKFGLRNHDITVPLIQKMVDAGADIHQIDNDPELKTPLMVATDAQNIVVVTYLIEQGVDLNSVDKCGHTALHIAAETGNLPLVQQLVESGADVTIVDENGLTAAEHAQKVAKYAQKKGHSDIVSYLDKQ